MNARFYQEGKALDYTPVADVAAGSIVALGNNHFGVAAIDIPAGTLGALAVNGVFEIAKEAGVEIAVGALVYWTTGTSTAGTTPVSNAYIGRAVAASVATDETVMVILNAVNVGAFTAVVAGVKPAAAVVSAPTTNTIAGTDYTGQAAIIKAAIEQNDTNIDALKTCLDALIVLLVANGVLKNS